MIAQAEQTNRHRARVSPPQPHSQQLLLRTVRDTLSSGLRRGTCRGREGYGKGMLRIRNHGPFVIIIAISPSLVEVQFLSPREEGPSRTRGSGAALSPSLDSGPRSMRSPWPLSRRRRQHRPPPPPSTLFWSTAVAAAETVRPRQVTSLVAGPQPAQRPLCLPPLCPPPRRTRPRSLSSQSSREAHYLEPRIPDSSLIPEIRGNEYLFGHDPRNGVSVPESKSIHGRTRWM